MSSFLEYVPGTSLLHRMNPVAKLAAAALFAVACFCSSNLVFLTVLLAVGFALAAILAIVLVHVLRRQDHTDHDSPRSVRDAEQRERDRRDGPDLGP